MLLLEIKDYAIHRALGSIYVASVHPRMVFEALNGEGKISSIEAMDVLDRNGAFWINPFQNKAFHGNTSHVELIRQDPELFGLDAQFMPLGTESEMYSAEKYQEYEAWLSKNDDPTSKMKLGLFRDGWIRGSYDRDEYFEFTGIPLAVKASAEQMIRMIEEINPADIGIEFYGEGLEKRYYSAETESDLVIKALTTGKFADESS